MRAFDHDKSFTSVDAIPIEPGNVRSLQVSRLRNLFRSVAEEGIQSNLNTVQPCKTSKFYERPLTALTKKVSGWIDIVASFSAG